MVAELGALGEQAAAVLGDGAARLLVGEVAARVAQQELGAEASAFWGRFEVPGVPCGFGAGGVQQLALDMRFAAAATRGVSRGHGTGTGAGETDAAAIFLAASERAARAFARDRGVMPLARPTAFPYGIVRTGCLQKRRGWVVLALSSAEYAESQLTPFHGRAIVAGARAAR
jgi:hypothetical protein